MSEPKRAGDRKLTGVWQGLYSYPQGAEDVPFTATLFEAGSLLSGSVHEPCLMGGAPGEILNASLRGSRDGSTVSFIKTYDGSNPNYRSVQYAGSANEDATEIEGRWTIPGVWSGRFLMMRSGNAPAEQAERKEVEETVK
jgi:hypothetical protein